MENEQIYNEIPYGKGVKHYNTQKKPLRQVIRFWTTLIFVLSKILTIGQKYKIEKINMEGVKPPYIMLCNHMHFVDFYLNSMATYPHNVYNIVNVDGYYRRPFLMELIGCICKRKFTTDSSLLSSIERVLFKYKGIMCMYPEARYSPAGTTAILPVSMGQLAKKMNVPVVVFLHHGNYLHTPFWNYRKKRKVPLHTVMTTLLTAEQVKEMSPEAITAAIREGLQYDEYQYQKDNGILITEPFRAEGMHKILYQCPHCKTESQMGSRGAELFCKHCGKRWTLKEDGSLAANQGETEFTRVPDWFAWERKQVEEQINAGTYSFEDEVEVYSLPRCWKFETLGKAKLTHTPEEGFVLTGEYNGAEYRIQRTPIQTNSLHIEYDYCYIKPFDCVDISTENDSFYCYPKKENVVTKLAFATEILYLQQEAKLLASRNKE